MKIYSFYCNPKELVIIFEIPLKKEQFITVICLSFYRVKYNLKETQENCY